MSSPQIPTIGAKTATGPTPEQIATIRSDQTMRAREMVRGWVDAMKRLKLSAIMINLEVPQNDGGSLFMGFVDEQLREAGYVIVSHSHALIGHRDQPEMPSGKIYLQNTSLLIRANNPEGAAPLIFTR